MGISSLLHPTSIAIVGASEKIGPGYNAVKALEFVGFEGEIHLVNPRVDTLFGRPTFPTLTDIPGPIDAVFVAVQADMVVEIARQAADKRAGALAILSSGFGETTEGAVAQHALIEVAAANDLAVCGPNCLGLLNFAGRSALFGTSLPDHVQRGGVAAIVQSGSVGIALLNSARGIGFSHIVTTGNEAVTSAADYIDALVGDPDVTTFLVFAEQINKPAAFMNAARRASQANKPVIVLKSGRTHLGKAAVMAHTGAVAGSDEACNAALWASGAIQVHSLDELIETTLLASKLKVRPAASGLGGLSISGGEIALVHDASEDLNLTFVPLGDAAATIADLLPAYSHVSNPLDLTWAGLYDVALGMKCAEAIARQPDVGAVVLFQDAPGGLGSQQAARYAALLEAVAKGARAANKPFFALSNVSDQPHPVLQAMADTLGIPYLRGTHTGLTAIAHILRRATAPAIASARPPTSESRAAMTAMARMPSHRLAAEHEARTVLAGYGVSGPIDKLVATPAEVRLLIEQFGYPIVIKGLVKNVIHKSDAGLVKVGIRSESQLQSAMDSLQDALKAFPTEDCLGYLVQQQITSVGEIFVGARVDPEFGPLVVVGAGGVQVELYKDVAIRSGVIDEAAALEAIASTKVSALLRGFRGAKKGDIAAVARTVSAVSRFITDFADSVSEVEINPLAVLEDGRGCVALDCVLVINKDTTRNVKQLEI